MRFKMHLGRLLERFCVNFGSILGAKMVPKSIQIALKSCSKKDCKRRMHRDRKLSQQDPLAYLCCPCGRHHHLCHEWTRVGIKFRYWIGCGRAGRCVFGINGKGPFPLGGLRRPPRIAPPNHRRRHHGCWRDFGLWMFRRPRHHRL